MRIVLTCALILMVSAGGRASEESLLARRAEIDRELDEFREWKKSTIGLGDLQKQRVKRKLPYGELAGTRPGLQAKARYLFHSRQRLSSPVYLTRGMAVIIQPDGIRTLCFLSNGEPFKGSPPYGRQFRNVPQIDTWETVDDQIIGWGNDEIAYGFPEGLNTFLEDDAVVYGGSVYLVHRNEDYEYVSTRTLDSIVDVVSGVYLLGYGGMDDHFYVLYRDDEGKYSRDVFGHRIRPVSRLACYSPEDASVKWQKDAQKGEKWLGMVLEGGRITVFGDKEGGGRGPTFAQVFTPDGEEAERFPVSAEMFGGDSDPAFRGSYEYKGTRYRSGGRRERPTSGENTLRVWRRIVEKFGPVGEVVAATELPGDGFAWIGIQKDRHGGSEFILHYADAVRAW